MKAVEQVTMNTIEETKHLFDRQGFGPGPYRLIGHNPNCTVQNLIKERGGDVGLWPGPDQPAGTCDSCGQGIKDVYTLRSATGTEFNVGCDCVEKAWRASGQKKVDPALREIRRIKAKAAKGREQERIEEMQDRLENDAELRAFLASLPHNNPRRAEQGETMLDSFTWMFRNAGHAGKIKSVRAIEKRLELGR